MVEKWLPGTSKLLRFKLCIRSASFSFRVTSNGHLWHRRCHSVSLDVHVVPANVWRRMRRIVPGDYVNPLMRESMMCCLTMFILSKVKSLTTQKPLIACFNLPRRRNLEMRVVLYADSHRFQRLQMKGVLDGNEQGKQSLRVCRSCSAHISQAAMNMSMCDSEACTRLSTPEVNLNNCAIFCQTSEFVFTGH